MMKKTYSRDSEVLWSVVTGDHPLAAWFLHHEYEVDATEDDGGGRTLLHWAAQENRVNIAHLLLSRGANPEAMDMNSITPFAQAAAENNLRLLKIMHHYGASPNGVTPNYVPLHIAVSCDYSRCTRYLLRHGADINATDENGGTALLLAVHHGHHGMASYLLRHGARLDVRDQEGTLMWELNEAKRIPLTTRDLSLEGGLTLWEMARENGDEKMLKILNSFRDE